MTAFSRYSEGRGFNLWVLGVTLLVLVGFLYLPVAQIQSFIDPTLRQTAAIFPAWIWRPSWRQVSYSKDKALLPGSSWL